MAEDPVAVQAEIKKEHVVETSKPVETMEESPEQINWKKFREERKADRKAREDAERKALENQEQADALKKAMEALVSKPDSGANTEAQDTSIEDKIKKAIEEHDKKITQERLEAERKELPVKLATSYKDFNEIVNPENLDYLEFHHPEIAAPYKHMPDTMEKWSLLYAAIKKHVPNNTSKRDIAKMEANLKGPQSMSSGVTQTGDHAPHILDEDRKKANYARMMKRLKEAE